MYITYTPRRLLLVSIKGRLAQHIRTDTSIFHIQTINNVWLCFPRGTISNMLHILHIAASRVRCKLCQLCQHWQWNQQVFASSGLALAAELFPQTWQMYSASNFCIFAVFAFGMSTQFFLPFPIKNVLINMHILSLRMSSVSDFGVCSYSCVCVCVFAQFDCTKLVCPIQFQCRQSEKLCELLVCPMPIMNISIRKMHIFDLIFHASRLCTSCEKYWKNIHIYIYIMYSISERCDWNIFGCASGRSAFPIQNHTQLGIYELLC